MKKAALVLTALLCLALLPSFALADDVPSPTSDFYVNDYADVLSASTEQHIMDVSVPLAEETGAQVVVLTVDTLDGMDIESYGLEVGREWGIGDAEKDNGLLILLAVKDREIRLEVGYGLEGAINDAKAGRLIRDYAQRYYANDEFDAGTLELYNAAITAVRGEYGLDALDGYEEVTGKLAEEDEFTLKDYIFFGAIAIFILWLIFAFFVWIFNLIRRIFGLSPVEGGCLLGTWLFTRGGGSGRGGGFGGFGGGGGFSGGGGGFGGGGASGKF